MKPLRTPFPQVPVSQNMKVYIWEQLSTVVLKMFGKYPGPYMHRIASYKFHKLKIGWIHITIKKKVLQNLENKLTVIFFKDLLKLANMLEWGLFLRELILLRGCEKILNSKISFCLFSTTQNCSTTIVGSRYFNPLMPVDNKKVTHT